MSNFADVMNCLTVILKPGFHFNALVEIERFLRSTLPKYEYENDGLYIEVEPLGISINELIFKLTMKISCFCVYHFSLESLGAMMKKSTGEYTIQSQR